MDRRTIQATAVAAIGILAVALAAATLSSAFVPGTGLGEGTDEEGDAAVSLPTSDVEDPGPATPLPDWVVTLLAFLAALATIVAALYVLRYWREVLPAVVLGTLAAIVLWFALRNLEISIDPAGPAAFEAMPVGNGNGDSDTPGGTLESPLLAFVFFALVALGAAVAVFGTSIRETAPEEAEATDEDGEATVEAIGRFAGRAADRLETESREDDDELENEVYRAWKEMTELLEVPDPETTTPGEFSVAAVEAGMRSDDVEELTRLFEEVRYGGYEPTGARERRAIDVFRRIESRYAPGDETEP